MNNTVKFYHYLPSSEFASDEEPGYQPKQDGAAIKSLYQMEGIPDDDSLSVDEDDDHFNTAVAMEEIDLEATPLPNMIWTPTKYKPKDVAQFISLLQNKNFKVSKAAKETGIGIKAAYKFNDQWGKNGGTILPGYKPVFEVKRKGNNVKLTEENSQYLNEFVEKHPTCIVKDATESLCETFHGSTINEFTVYRHITEKLEFTLTRTQARFVNRNSDDNLEQRRQFIEHIDAINDETFYKRRCIFVDESGFKKNMVRPVAWSKKGEPAEVDVEAEGTNLKEIVSVLNKLGLKNMYIVMDNAAINKTPEVLKAIRDSGHYALFLPPYSPMLNPIEECWAKIKSVVRKTPLAKNEMIADRIEEAAKTVTAKNCRGWIRHSQRQFPKYRNMERL
ncbi:hypothetical protein [Parasitella parasitica]|uniref:Tc1-like transposase DDE domain-containing protein n=1 Tax=Parasitella parasitica TaxID=35722 RepID=A0A0B7NSE9_9FUNG|nr:hypothetical protein [Parasitella parasitica]